jgi:hypothetical protein
MEINLDSSPSENRFMNLFIDQIFSGKHSLEILAQMLLLGLGRVWEMSRILCVDHTGVI